MLDWTQCPAAEQVRGKVSGAWVFKTTRVPVRALVENLEDGATVNEFLTWFPGVTRQQVEAEQVITIDTFQAFTARSWQPAGG
jgi:uncharacterized protein (DUF433 family)